MLKKIIPILSILILFVMIGVSYSVLPPQKVFTWVAPTTNTDGSPLTDLAGFKIYCGDSTGGPYLRNVDVPGALSTTYTDNTNILVTGTGTSYCVATAYDTSGNESIYSVEVVIGDFLAPAAPINLIWK